MLSLSFTYIFVATLVSLSLVRAAPIPKTIVERGAPAGWAYDWLEDYDVYHTRYLALSCHTQKNTPFFKSCCSPLLKTETLAVRPDYCTAPQAALASVSSSLVAKTAVKTAAPTTAAPPAAATTSAVVDSSDSAAWCDEEEVSTSAVAQPTVVAAVAPSPTTTSKAAPAAGTTLVVSAPVTSSSDGAVQTGGHATYFYQGGNAGACGNVAQDSDYVIAVPQKWWATSSGSASSLCGKQIEITRSSSGAKVTATVADLCPSCTSDNSLDLSVGAFTKIATESEGMVDITWKLL